MLKQNGFHSSPKTPFTSSYCTVAQKCHGNFNFITAISISPRQFQLRSRQFQLRSRQFQLCHGNFNFTTAISTLFTAISTSFTAISISISPQGVYKSCEKEINCSIIDLRCSFLTVFYSAHLHKIYATALMSCTELCAS